MTSDDHSRVRLADYRPPAYLVDRVNLDFNLRANRTDVRSRLAIRPNPARPGGAALVLDGEDLELAAIALDGIPLTRADYVISDRALTIADVPDQPFTLDVTTIVDPAANTRLSGLYRSNGIYCTQCEAEGFRRITYFPDRPDILAAYTVRIEADRGEAPVLLSNGNPAESGRVAGSDRHYAVWRDPFPKPSYLFALVAGDLGLVENAFRTMSGRDVRLGIYVERGKEDRCGFAMEALKRAIRWDEEAFGREYDLDVFNIVAVSDFNMGAMENKGLNVFNDKFILASPQTATDADYASIDSIIAHEYFHNWTGNRITCRDWFQLCLKEGLTVFRDQEYSADTRSRAVERISDVRALRTHQFVEDAGPLAHPVRPDSYREINNFYTATVYEKGAEVVRMLRTLIGTDAFRRGMDIYFSRHDGTAATVEDFLACFETASGRGLERFALWYSQAGTPEITATGRHDPARRTYELTLEQTVPATPGQRDKLTMPVPIAFGLIGADGREITPESDDSALLRDGLIELSGARHTVVFRDVAELPVPSLLRNFSAPVNLTINLSGGELIRLVRHDSDPFNRWQAAQTVQTRLLMQAQSGIGAGRMPAFDDAFGKALDGVAGDDSLDPAFRAQILTPPSEADIAREIGRNVDPGAVHAADEWLRRSVADRLMATLDAIYARFATNAPYVPDAEGAGRRSLRNTALALLSLLPDGAERALAHYRGADNMTDRIAALAALCRQGGAQAEEALSDFHDRYRDNPLVLDKWLSLQATMPHDGAVARVRELMGHPAFSATNPNRLRALVGAFAMANPTQFNRPDGAGYRLLADVVLDTDPANPQVAARLLSAFRSWRALEPARRERAESELHRVQAREGLSRDVADIVQRCLE